jgi:hypothetical protein
VLRIWKCLLKSVKSNISLCGCGSRSRGHVAPIVADFAHRVSCSEVRTSCYLLVPLKRKVTSLFDQIACGLSMAFVCGNERRGSQVSILPQGSLSGNPVDLDLLE